MRSVMKLRLGRRFTCDTLRTSAVVALTVATYTGAGGVANASSCAESPAAPSRIEELTDLPSERQ